MIRGIIPKSVNNQEKTYSESEIEEKAKKKMELVHKRAVIMALADAFQDFSKHKIIVFLGTDELIKGDPEFSNFKIVTELLRASVGNDRVKAVRLSDLIEKYKREHGINPVIVEAHFAPQEISGKAVLKSEKSTRSNTSRGFEAKAGISGGSNIPSSIGDLAEISGALSIKGVSKTSKEEESKTEATLATSIEHLREPQIRDFLNKLKLLAEVGKDEILLVYLDRSDYPELANKLIEMAKTDSTVYVFLDKGIKFDDIASVLNDPHTINETMSTSNILLEYLKALRNELNKMLSKEPKEIASLLDFMSETMLDELLVIKLESIVDTAPGVALELMKTVIARLYAKLKYYYARDEDFRKKLQTMEPAKLFDFVNGVVEGSGEEFAENYQSYAWDASRDAYVRYLKVAEELSGLPSSILAKTIYVLSAFAEVQAKQKKSLLFTGDALVEEVKNIASPEEVEKLEQGLPKLLEALNKLGFMKTLENKLENIEKRLIIEIKRPQLMIRYGYYAEEQLGDKAENLERIRETMKSEIESAILSGLSVEHIKYSDIEIEYATEVNAKRLKNATRAPNQHDN